MFEEILDIFTGRMKPVSIAFVEQLGLQALESALTKKNDINRQGPIRARPITDDSAKEPSQKQEKSSN